MMSIFLELLEPYFLQNVDGHDLLKVPDDTLATIIDLTKANSLIRIPLPKQGDTGRDLYIEREEDEPEPETTAKPQRQSRN